jgi:hypothetical protein
MPTFNCRYIEPDGRPRWAVVEAMPDATEQVLATFCHEPDCRATVRYLNECLPMRATPARGSVREPACAVIV